MGVGDRVIVQVKAHVGGLRGTHDDTFLAGEGLCRQCQQPRVLLLEARPDAAISILRTRSFGRLALTPGECLGVQVRHIREAPGSKEALAHEADRVGEALQHGAAQIIVQKVLGTALKWLKAAT